MRLYLSSFRLGNHSKRLVELVGENKRAAIILNSCDLFPDSDREMRFCQEATALESLGFQTSEIDLRVFFNDRQKSNELKPYINRV